MSQTSELLVGSPLEAWRAWTLVERPRVAGPVLAGIYLRVPWIPRRPMVAHCVAQLARGENRPPAHRAPSLDPDGCGIYASSSPMDLETWLQLINDRPQVIGRVALWGRVIRHERGFRAEYAYPIELFALESAQLPDADATASRLAQLYGVAATAVNGDRVM